MHKYARNNNGNCLITRISCLKKKKKKIHPVNALFHMLPTYNLLSLWSITGAAPCVILLHLIALEKHRQILGHTKFLHPWNNETNRSRDTDGDVHIVGAFWKTSQKLRCRLNVPSSTRSCFPRALNLNHLTSSFLSSGSCVAKRFFYKHPKRKVTRDRKVEPCNFFFFLWWRFIIRSILSKVNVDMIAY